MLHPNLYILTGGPGAGKTTVLLELEKLGYPYLPEVARQIIQEQVRVEGAALPWKDTTHYTRLMHERSVTAYKAYAANTKPTFADRGIPDTLSYARLIGLDDQGFLRQACDEYRYAPQVFIAPPWKEIYATDTERKQDFAEAIRTYEVLADTYRECEYNLIELPKASPQERANIILTHILTSQTLSS